MEGKSLPTIAMANPNEVGKLILISPAGFSPKSFLGSPGLRKYVDVMDATSKAEIIKALSETSSSPVSGKDASMVFERISMPGVKLRLLLPSSIVLLQEGSISIK